MQNNLAGAKNPRVLSVGDLPHPQGVGLPALHAPRAEFTTRLYLLTTDHQADQADDGIVRFLDFANNGALSQDDNSVTNVHHVLEIVSNKNTS